VKWIPANIDGTCSEEKGRDGDSLLVYTFASQFDAKLKEKKIVYVHIIINPSKIGLLL